MPKSKRHPKRRKTMDWRDKNPQQDYPRLNQLHHQSLADVTRLLPRLGAPSFRP